MASYNKGIVKYVRKRLDESRAGWNDYYKRQNTANTIGAIGQAGAQIIGAYGQRQEKQKNELAAIELGKELGFSPQVASRVDLGVLAKAALSIREQKAEDLRTVTANRGILSKYLPKEQVDQIPDETLLTLKPDHLVNTMEARVEAMRASGALGPQAMGPADALKVEQAKATYQGTMLSNQQKRADLAGSDAAGPKYRYDPSLNELSKSNHGVEMPQEYWDELSPKDQLVFIRGLKAATPDDEFLALIKKIEAVQKVRQGAFMEKAYGEMFPGVKPEFTPDGLPITPGVNEAPGTLPAPGMTGQGAPQGDFFSEILGEMEAERQQRAQYGGR